MTPQPERLEEALVVAALEGLDALDPDDRERVRRAGPDLLLAFELTAAQATADLLGAPDEPLPEDMAALARASARGFFAAREHTAAVPTLRAVLWLASGLALVAMALVVAAAIVSARPASRDDRPERVLAALRAAADVRSAPFGPSDQPAFRAASGSVVWSTERQDGVIELHGLPPNDPEREQYQLWIVDPTRDREPVDGGVFDAPDGEVLARVTPKLEVTRPQVFAITREQRGGVVVSEGPLLLVARLE